MRDHGGKDHGGNLDVAMARYGAGDWIDLSTGINRRTYPMPEMPPSVWTALPTATVKAGLLTAARNAWGVAKTTHGVALAGAQAAIQMVPFLRPVGQARVLSPTYNEHAAAVRVQGWEVVECKEPGSLAGADLAVVVNPNNPDGRSFAPDALLNLAGQVGLLVVDESFADTNPELSLLPQALPPNLLVLRSFGKFYGLAGLRLGFAFGAEALIDKLVALSGPWPVSGAAIHAGMAALADAAWADAMRVQLAKDARRADALALRYGWALVGGTPLFRLYETPDAMAAQDHLARHQIWSRIFPWSPTWIRLGLPGTEAEWNRLSAALTR